MRWGEIMVLNGNRNLATGLRGVTVRTSGSLESPPVWSRENLIDGQNTVGAPLRKSARPRSHGWQAARSRTSSAVAWVQIDLGSVQPFDEARLVPARLTQFSSRQGYGFPGKFLVEVANDAEFTSSRVLADWTAHPIGNPAFNPVTVPGDGWPTRYLRITAREFWQRGQNNYVFALAELQVYQGDRNLAAGASVTTDRASLDRNHFFNPAFLTDGLRGTLEFVEWPEWLGSLSRRREVLHELDGIRVELAAMQLALARATTWTFGTAGALLVLGTLATLYRARRAQARAVAALQRRIAGDLHDEIGSNLASIAMLTELGQRQATGIADEDVDEIRRLASESAAAMRDLVWLIQPGPHDAPQLADRLRATARRLLCALKWQFEIAGLEIAPPLDVQRHLLLALKEMLHNVVRHANAQQVDIRLMVRAERFTLEVRDNGRGFDPSCRGDGHGFTSLRHRAELLGGALEIDSRPGLGTRISLIGALHPSVRLSAHSV
jgi:signal transduction histidine kinase